MLEGVRLGVCLVDEAGKIIDLDGDFAALLGLASDGSTAGKALSEVLASAPRLPALGATHAVVRGAVGRVELICKPGAGPVGHTLIAQQLADVGHTVSAERSSEGVAVRRELERILETAPLAIVCLDDQRRVTLWSGAAERMFGWTRAEVLGRPYPLVPEDRREEFDRLWAESMSVSQSFAAVEITRQRKDGTRIDLRLHTTTLTDDEGAQIGSVAMLEDLTTTRRLEARARQSQRMEAVSSLAGGIAHDFNNLLSVVVAMADLLELDDDLGTEGKGRAAEIQRVARAARELVAQLMTFSDRQIVRPEVFDLNTRVETGAKMIQHLLGPDTRLELTLAPRTVRVRLDPAQFDQLLLNLAVNAVDAMAQGGQLRCATSVCELPTGPFESAPFACLIVRDTGCGIESEVLPNIFDPFFTTKPTGTATGLGLANVYAVATQAGGHVEVESQVGHGSSFFVYLPLEAELDLADGVPCRRTHEVSRPRGSERILLVEDNDVVRRSTARLLGVLGYEVEVAENGALALERILDGLMPDLVLTDVAMPVMGGAELARALLKHAPQLPVLFMSGNLDVSELREQVEQRRIRFLQKPATLRELAAATREILDGDPS